MKAQKHSAITMSVPPIWIYTPSDAQLSPFHLVYSKKYVDMENLFLFQFCLRDLFVKNEDAPFYARPIYGKGALALGQFKLANILSHTPRHAQPLSAPPGRVYGERITQHTLLNIPNKWGLNCASDGVWIRIGGTDSLMDGCTGCTG